MNNRENQTQSRFPISLKSGAGRLLAAGMGLYLIVGILGINRGYIDFGDGNYLYISWRMADGARLYQDIVSPQPPLHLKVGALLIRLGEAFGGGMLTLTLVRLFSIGLHLATAGFVALTAKRLFEDDWTAALSGCIYLFLPIGFFWARGYQSEPLEIFFLTVAFWALLQSTRRTWALAGACSALALFTNMTAVPYVVLFGVYALTVPGKKSQGGSFLLALAGIGIGLLGLFYLTSGGTYFENVIFNQVGTFHRTDPFGYAVRKIISQGGNVLVAEGGFVLCAALGAVVYLSQESLPVRSGAVWYLFWSLGSIVFVSKGGTEDYIFCLGEPMVAVFSGFFLRFFYLGTFSAWLGGSSKGRLAERLTRGATLLTLVLVLIIRPSWELFDTVSQSKYELPSWDVKRVMEYMERFSEPGDPLWAPPFYAFLARRPIPEDASSTFIWYMRYTNHRWFFDPDEEVMPMISRIVSQLDGEQVPVVLLNLRPGQLGAIDEIRQAVETHYTWLPDSKIRSRNEDLRIYVSKNKMPALDLKNR